MLLGMSWYSAALENVLLPLSCAARRRDYSRRRRFLDRAQWWRPEQLRDFQWRELQKLLAAVFASSPYYQKKYAAAGARFEDIRTWDDFRRLPPLTREEVIGHRDELRCADFRGRLIPHATGGSSGTPVRFWLTLPSYDWRTAASDRVYSWSGWRLGERTLYLWGAPVGTPPLASRLRMSIHRALRRQRVVPTFSQTERLWLETHGRALRFRPRFLVGYVSSLLHFAQYLTQRDLRLPGLRAVLAAAEPLEENAREYIGRAFDAPVFNTYGSREFMSIGGECERHDGLHVNAENLVVETAGGAQDEASEILVTDLHNYGMPFIRYAIGDLGAMSGKLCACGRGLPMLRTVQGRARGGLTLAGGRVISSIFFAHMLKDIPEVLAYQVEQKSLDRLWLSLVLSGPLSESSRALIVSETRKTVGESATVELREVAELPRGPSGKYENVRHG